MEQVLIERLRDLTPSLDSEALGKSRKSENAGGGFAAVVSQILSEVNQKQNAAAADAEGLAAGKVDIMDAVVSLNEADLSLRMMMQIRDRALDAYQRIMRTI